MIAEFYNVLLTLYYISHLSYQRQLTTKWKLGLMAMGYRGWVVILTDLKNIAYYHVFMIVRHIFEISEHWLAKFKICILTDCMTKAK
jgi:hypothetical protein